MLVNLNAITAAKKSYGKYGVPASVTLAQYIDESGNGEHEPAGSNNPFGIKAVGNDDFVAASTYEVINGHSKQLIGHFRKYASLDDAFDDHARLLANGKPYQAIKKYLTSPTQYCNALTGIYATDPKYGDKLNRLIIEYNLTQYDIPIKPAAETTTKVIGVVATGAVIAEVAAQAPAVIHSGVSVGMEYLMIGGGFYLLGLLTIIVIACVLYFARKSKPANPGNVKEMYEMFLQSYQPILDYINAKQAQSVADAKTIADLQGQVATLTAAANDSAAVEQQNEADTLQTLTAATNGDGVTAVVPPPATPPTQ